MYAIDRRHKKFASDNTEFKHHGIMGQKWGVITRNVGVNYVPIGRKTKESQSTSLKPLSDGQKDVIKKCVCLRMGNMSDKLINTNSKVLDKYFKNIKEDMSYNQVRRTVDKINHETYKQFWKNLKQYEKEHPNLKGWDSFNNYREYLAKNSSIEIGKNNDGFRLVMSMIDDAPLELCVDYNGNIQPSYQTLLFNKE